MTSGELETILTLPFEEGCGEAWSYLLLDRDGIVAAMDLALGKKGVVPFRAAYALERAFLSAPERFEPTIQRLTEDFQLAVHPSVWRHYGKIVALLLKKGLLVPTDEQAARIAETAVERLIDERIPVGARVWSLDILHHLRGRLGWIDGELPAMIEGLTVAPTPAMVSRLRRYGWITT